MLAKFLKEVVVILVGKQAEPIADLLESKKHVNEFLIAKKLGLTINQTRNILYKIADHGLVSSVRKKDKRKGWYTYFWKLENLKALEFLKELLAKKIENTNNQIKSRETKVFYVCPDCHVEYNEENSLLHDFTCLECGQIFVKSDSVKVLKELKREEEKFHKELAIIEDEINKERTVVEKKRVLEKNKFERERKEKRKIALTKAKKEREKLKRINPKAAGVKNKAKQKKEKKARHKFFKKVGKSGKKRKKR